MPNPGLESELQDPSHRRVKPKRRKKEGETSEAAAAGSKFDQQEQEVQGSQYNAGRDIHYHGNPAPGEQPQVTAPQGQLSRAEAKAAVEREFAVVLDDLGRLYVEPNLQDFNPPGPSR